MKNTLPTKLMRNLCYVVYVAMKEQKKQNISFFPPH